MSMGKRGWVVLVALTLCMGAAQASNIEIYVDAAPNVFGSPDYAPWQADVFQQVANGTFVNMSNAHSPADVGTTDFSIYDEVVYSFGDLGSRLTWIYWLPGQNVADLDAADCFEISLTNIWDGDVMDFYLTYYGSTWLEPSKWVDYDSDGDGITDGVMGTAGMAWWGAYNTNTQAELDADIAAWAQAEESWIFTARLNCPGVQEVVSLTSHRAPVPEPATIGLLGMGIAGLAVRMRRKS